MEKQNFINYHLAWYDESIGERLMTEEELAKAYDAMNKKQRTAATESIRTHLTIARVARNS